MSQPHQGQKLIDPTNSESNRWPIRSESSLRPAHRQFTRDQVNGSYLEARPFKPGSAKVPREPKAITEYLRNPDDCGIGCREKRGNFAQLSAVNIWCRQMAMVFGADWRFIGSRL